MPTSAQVFRRFAAIWAILFGFWLLYLAEVSWRESLVGLGAAAAGAWAVRRTRLRGLGAFAPYGRWIWLARDVPAAVFRDTALLAGVLGRRVLGRPAEDRMRVLRFARGGGTDQDAARRALAIALTSMPPNSFVVGIDPKRDWLLLHQARLADVSRPLRALSEDGGDGKENS